MESLTLKQKQVLDFITAYCDENGYPPTVRELCAQFGLKSPNTAHFHLKGLQDKGYIRIASGKNRGITVLKTPPDTGLKIPLLGKIAAGAPILAVENLTDTLDIDRTFFGSPDAFSVIVQGDSMIDAHIEDGDYVVIRPCSLPKNGDIAAILIDDEVTLKYFFSTENQIELRPANSKYSPLVFTPESFVDIRILGIMAGLIRKGR